jgi:hypothetical protein
VSYYLTFLAVWSKRGTMVQVRGFFCDSFFNSFRTTRWTQVKFTSYTFVPLTGANRAVFSLRVASEKPLQLFLSERPRNESNCHFD